MISRKAWIVTSILALIGLIAAWSKLHNIDDEDFAPQRVPASEHPAFKQ